MKSIRTFVEPFILSHQELANLVLDQMDAAVLICDKQSRIVLANPAAQTLFGGDPIGKLFTEAFPLFWLQPDEVHAGALFDLEPVLRGDTFRGRAVLRPSGQPERQVTIHSAPYRGPQDEVLCCIVSMMDLSQSEQARERADELLSAVVQGTTDAIFVKDPAGRYLMINQAGAAVMGRPMAEVVGKRVDELIDAATAQELRADDERVMQTGQTEVIENKIPSPSGPRIYQTVKAPHRDATGAVVGLVGVSRDITELREAQAAVARQAALLDLSPDAFLVRTLEGKIIFWSRGAALLYGWTANEAVGQITHELLQTRFSVSRAVQETALREQGQWEGELVHVTRAGKTIVVSSRQLTQYDAGGNAATVLEINEDITERKAREDAQQFLIRATNELTESLNFEATLTAIARLAVPFLADWCAVHILMEDGIIRRLAFAHQDPAVVTRVTARPQQYALDANARHLVPFVLRTGETELFNRVPDSVLQEAARDEAHLETLRQLGLQAYLCIPLQARGRILGTVTFAMSGSGRTFSSGDVDLAQELVRRAGLAADNARLYEDSQIAQARLQIVSEVSNELFASLNYETRLERLAQVVVPRFADWCTINVAEADGTIQLKALAHRDPEMLPVIREWAARHPLSPDAASGTPNVIRTGKAEWVGDVHQTTPAPDAPSERVHYWERLRVGSYMIVPLMARGRVLGAITFVQAESQRRFTFQDLLTAEQIARRAAIALDNAALYTQEQQARRQAEAYAVRVSTLQNVTASLATALTPREVAKGALLPILTALGAYGGSVSLLTPDGENIELVESHGYAPEIVQAWAQYPLAAEVPIAQAMRTGKPVLLSSEEAVRTNFPQIWQKQSALQGKAWAAVPLVLEGRVLGVLGLSFMDEHRFDAQEEAFMTALAQQTALAMERAQLYEAERTARAFAEQNAARVSALQRITAMLGTALTREQVAEVVVRQGMNALNAQGGIVTQLSEDGSTVHILNSNGYSAAFAETWKQFPANANLAMAEVIRTGEPLVFESIREYSLRYPQRGLPPQSFGAWILLPLEFKGRISGSLTLAFAHERPIGQADRAFAIALAQQCAQAMERARLFESESAARRVAEHAAQRSEWLTEASHILSSSLDYSATLADLAQLVVSELADWCTIDMAKGDGTAEQLVLTHRDPEKLKWAKDYGEEIKQYFKPNWDSPRGLPNVLRTGKSEIYYDIPEAFLRQVAENEVQFNILKGIGYSSVMIVPLIVQGKTLGAITMVNTDSGRHFTDEDLAFAELFAERAAVAMENARLYRELQSVNTELQSLNTELERRVGQRTFELSEAYDELSKEVVERTRAEETTRALLRISNKLNSSLDVETTLEILIQEAIRIMEGAGGFAGLRTDKGMRMHKYYANDKSIPIEYTWEPGKGMPGWVLEHGTPYVTNDAPNDPVMLHELPFNAQVQNAICTPIHDAQGRVLGFFEVRDKAGGKAFTGADVEFLMALSPIASIALENAQAYQRISQAESVVQASYAQLRALAARLQTIREEERTDIARELHDELGQALTALKMDLASLMSRLPQRSKQLRERAQAMSEQIDVTIKTVRRMSSQLRPGMLDDLGLGPSIEWYGQEFQARTGILVHTQVPEEELTLSQPQATALYRIFQETLTNVARHAHATEVRASLQVQDNVLALQIADDGRGIDLDQARIKRSLGLLGMRERAEMVHGTLEIQGAPGEGTTVLVRLPLVSPRGANGDSYRP